MIFKYGDYEHDQDEVMIRTSETAIMDKFMRRMGQISEWTIFGVCQVPENPAGHAATQADLTTKLDALVEAYKLDYQDCGLYLNDGTTATEHVIENDNTFGGVKVVSPPAFLNGPWTGRIEYYNRRTYFLVIRFETRVGSGLYDWDERITIKGTGGTKWRYSPQETGSPQKQDLQALTTFQYIQEGSCIGRQDWEPPSDPLYPTIEHGDLRVRVFESAKDKAYDGATLTQEMFGTSWRYVMETHVSESFSAFVVPTI